MNELDVNITKLCDDATIPSYTRDGDAGLDLVSTSDVRIAPGARAIVPTGLAIEIPCGYAGYVQPRSGLALKHGITVLNTPGLIDSNYRGELKVILLNTGDEAFEVKKGDRIAQLVILAVPTVRLHCMDALSDTDRGTHGFGSSGTR
ncbi:dUTP diphosphatase [bacterium]|nr:dUTP diphosphatase [bacterium]